MTSIEYDLRYLARAIEQLKTYLLSNELYWPLGLAAPSGEAPYPPMTLGNLLLSRERLRARLESGALESGHKVTLLGLEERLEALMQAWLTAWQAKAEREFSSRVAQWKDKLDEIGGDPANRAGYYASEVRERVLLDLLAEELREKEPAELGLLPILDERLRAYTSEADFLWEEELQTGFDREKYWYLYRMAR